MKKEFSYFKGATISGDVKILKPNPQLFDIFLNNHNLRPEECVMVDDKSENIDVVKSMGMNGIVFNREKFKNIVYELREYEIISFSDVDQIFRDIELS